MRPWTIHTGDVRQVMRTFPTNHFDACLSDPPYGISFMGNRWDYRLPSVHVWTELLRVLKPGAHALLFGGSRTFHRLCVAVEDAGFVPTDVLMWLYSQGFPKSHDISKAIDKRLGKKRTKVLGHKQSGLDRGSGATVSFAGSSGRDETGLIPIMEPATERRAQWQGQGTQLKPAYEPCLMVEKPFLGTYAENALRYGVGGIAVDASRIGMREARIAHLGALSGVGMGYGGSGPQEAVDGGKGWFPSNIILDEETAVLLDQQTGGLRFFYVAKADRKQRDAGCEGLAGKPQGVGALRDGKRAGGTDRSSGGAQHTEGVKLAKNYHSCVKPIDLMRYLARMLLPPARETPRAILVPYSGSGSEMIGCLQAGWDVVVGIEREAAYVEIAEARITKGGVLSNLMKKR